MDETRLEDNNYNWGYDPKNYNVPDGSYSTDPANPVIRIREFKEMVKSLHQNGFRIVLDVVYNHTASTDHSNFNLTVPGYFFRQNPDGLTQMHPDAEMKQRQNVKWSDITLLNR